MLWKLSITGIKSRLRDYLILFSGLVFASAIFYMFLTIATNPAFLKGNLTISFSITKYVFAFGTVLLALITLVYIAYANSFLLSMRKKAYGLYLMLGARAGKIGQLIFLETLIVGILAALLGIALGLGLTQLVAGLLISQLGLQLHHFMGFYLPAVYWTLLFFVVLFFLAAFWNRYRLLKTSLIGLLHGEQKPVKLRTKSWLQLLETVLGLVLLAVGYWAMSAYDKLQTNSVLLALVTIVPASYFIFSGFFSFLITLLRKNQTFKYRRLHVFTLGQLSFRLSDYPKILATISLLFALALGAITVGLNFNGLTDQAMESTYYDLTLNQQNRAIDQNLKKVSVRQKQHFNYKQRGQTIYVVGADIDQAQLKYQHFFKKAGQAAYRTKTITSRSLRAKDSESQWQLAELTPNSGARVKVVTASAYRKLPMKQQRVDLLLVNNFKQNFKQIEKVQKMANQQAMQAAAGKNNVNISLNNSKAAQYRLVINIASGFEFMGFFLGLAFLGMLASTLMFKVLSGAAADRPRYQMLLKIGSPTSCLRQSLASEIGTLFGLPAVLGIVDVLFGLQFFKSLLPNPYQNLWLPFTIFIVLYLAYYLLTVKLYQRLVFKR